MRPLKWLLQPTYVLLFVIGVIIYLNRNALFPAHSQSSEIQSVTGKVDSLIATLQSEQPNAPQEPSPKQSQSNAAEKAVSSDLPEGKGDDAPARSPTVVEGSEAQASSRREANAKYNESVPQGVAADAYPEQNSEKAQSSQSGEQLDAMPRTKPEAQTEKRPNGAKHDVAVNAEAMPQSAPAVSQEQLMRTWQQARIAAWYGDFNTSIDYYQSLITLQPTNYDAYGEMGNVMLRAGDREGAAEAYYQAAHLLMQTHQQEMAWYLLNVIAGLSPAKAEKLYQELMQHPPQN